jgi:hypothetical protein
MFSNAKRGCEQQQQLLLLMLYELHDEILPLLSRRCWMSKDEAILAPNTKNFCASIKKESHDKEQLANTVHVAYSEDKRTCLCVVHLWRNHKHGANQGVYGLGDLVLDIMHIQFQKGPYLQKTVLGQIRSA